VPLEAPGVSPESTSGARFSSWKRALRHPLRVFALALVLLVGLGPPLHPQPPDTVDALVTRYFDAETDDERATLLKTLQQRRDITIAQVEDAVRRGVFYKPQDPGTFTRKIHLEFDRSQTDCTFFVPPGYDARKPYPALVIMHGTGGTGEAFLGRWLPWVANRNMIVIAPTAVTGVDKTTGKPFGRGHGYGTHEIERSVPISAINAARRLYHIDSDRIYITGVSMGGHATWDSILTRTDYFAGGVPEAGVPLVEGFQLAKYLFLPNLFQVRMWVMQGTPDKDQPQINAEATERLRKMGYEAEYRQYEGKGHGSYPEDSNQALDFVLAAKRNNYSRKIVKVVHHLAHGRAYWVRIEKIHGAEWDPEKRVEVKIEGPLSKSDLLERAESKVQQQLALVEAEVLPDNVINVKTRKIDRLTVFLHDKLIDMDKPITIRVNGRIRLRKSVARDMGFMLEEVRRQYDTGRIFYNSVTVSAN